MPFAAILVNCAPSGEMRSYCIPHIIKENSENFLIHRFNYILLSQVYCVWQVVKTPTIIFNNPVHPFYLWFKCCLLSATLKVNTAPCLVTQQRINAYAGLEMQLHSFLSWVLDTGPPPRVSRVAFCAMDERKSLTAGSLCVGQAAAFNVVHPFIAMSWIYREHVTHETRFVGVLSCLLSVQVPHWQRHSAGHSLLILCSAPTGTCRMSEW